MKCKSCGSTSPKTKVPGKMVAVCRCGRPVHLTQSPTNGPEMPNKNLDRAMTVRADAEATARAFEEGSKPPARSTQTHSICGTDPCCECTIDVLSVWSCDCVWNGAGRCVECGAQQVAIDFETGKVLPS